MSLIVTVEEREGYITRNGVTTYEPELWHKLKASFDDFESEDDE